MGAPGGVAAAKFFARPAHRFFDARALSTLAIRLRISDIMLR